MLFRSRSDIECRISNIGRDSLYREGSCHFTSSQFRYLITYKALSYPQPPRGPIPLSPSPLSIATTPRRPPCLRPPNTLSTHPLPLSLALQLTVPNPVSLPPEFPTQAQEQGENAPSPQPSRLPPGNPPYPLLSPIPTLPRPKSRHMTSPSHKRRFRCAM